MIIRQKRCLTREGQGGMPGSWMAGTRHSTLRQKGELAIIHEMALASRIASRRGRLLLPLCLTPRSCRAFRTRRLSSEESIGRIATGKNPDKIVGNLLQLAVDIDYNGILFELHREAVLSGRDASAIRSLPLAAAHEGLKYGSRGSTTIQKAWRREWDSNSAFYRI